MKRISKQLGKLFFLGGILLLNSCGNNVDVEETEDKTDTTTTGSEIKPNMPSAVEFPSLDGLLISAVLWEIDPTAPTILMCHQAGYNYHEYDEIAPKLNDLGYNCLAIDQRAGGILFDVVNQTADRAITEGKTISYVEAEQDIVAAIDYCSELYQAPIIVWGSSYSAGLALHLSQTNDHVAAVIAFSPGDYYEGEKPLLAATMKEFSKPYFITSSKREGATISEFLTKSISDSLHIQFIPEKDGIHGSKALWESTENQLEYWDALKSFLKILNQQTEN